MNEQKTGKSKLDKGIFRAVKKDGTVYYRASLTYRGKHIRLGTGMPDRHTLPMKKGFVC